MKKLTLAIVFTLLTTIGTTWAQGFYFGPKAGLNLSSVSSLSNSKSRLRGEVGAMLGYQVGSIVAIQAEALYSWQGTRTEEFGTQIDLSLNYLKVPVVAKIFLIGGLNVEAGVSFNFLTSARALYEGVNEGIKDLNGFDLSIPIGVSYVIANRFDIGLRYDISLVNLNLPASGTAKNSNFSLSVAYRF